MNTEVLKGEPSDAWVKLTENAEVGSWRNRTKRKHYWHSVQVVYRDHLGFRFLIT